MIDINKNMPGRPKRIFLVSFIVFLVSSALLLGVLSYYKPLKPTLIKVTIDQIAKTSAGFQGRLLTDQVIPEARVKDKSYRFVLGNKDTSTLWLAFPGDSAKQDQAGAQTYLVQLKGICAKHIADSILNGELIVFRNSESGLLTNLIK